MFDTQRLAQIGLVERHALRRGRTSTVDPDTTWGSRDRSWGVRPVGEKEPDGIRTGANAMGGGMWSYFPMRFDDHSIFYICSETADGERTLEQAERVWLDGADRAARPAPSTTTRFVRRASGCWPARSITFLDAGVEIDVHAAARRTTSPSAPATASSPTGATACTRARSSSCRASSTTCRRSGSLGAYAVVDHAARFEYDGHVGYGLYEHAFSGAMPRYGLTLRSPPE